METPEKSWQETAFGVAFVVLTVLVWCPLGYGQYGPAGRTFGIPTWAATALGLGVLLFILEWIYLFKTGLALNDETLPDIMRELEMTDAQVTITTGEGK